MCSAVNCHQLIKSEKVNRIPHPLDTFLKSGVIVFYSTILSNCENLGSAISSLRYKAM